MKNLFYALLCSQIALIFSDHATTQMGATVSCPREKVQVTLHCDQTSENVEYCQSATLVYADSNHQKWEQKGTLNWNVIRQPAKHFTQRFKPKETNVQAFNEATTAFGKLVLGLIEYPRLALKDLDYKRALEAESA